MTDPQDEQRAMPPNQQSPSVPASPTAAYGPPAPAYGLPAPAYGPPTPGHYGRPAPLAPGTQRLAVASLSLGIVGLATSAIPGVNIVTAVGAVVGIVLGAKVVRGDRAGVKKAVWGIALSSVALLATAVTWALIVLALVSYSTTPDGAVVAATTSDGAVAATMKSDALNYSVAAEANYASTMEYPASADIPAGTVPLEFQGVTASENTISFVNNGESFVITVTNPAAAPDETIVYDSLNGFVTP